MRGHITIDEMTDILREEIPLEGELEKHIEECPMCCMELEALLEAQADFPFELWAKEREAFIAKLRKEIFPW